VIKSTVIKPGKAVHLADHPPDARLGMNEAEEAERLTAAAGERLAEHTTRLAADGHRAVLVVLQGMDASGKDGAVKKCIGVVNPMMIRIASFKAPTSQDLAHDFLWRITRELPGRGQLGVFNRSHYEDVLVVRVENIVSESMWRPRYDAINAWEQNLANEGTTIVKFFLHISKAEQAERFQKRLEDPRKNWKFNADDLDKREKWEDYMAAYEEMLERTSTKQAPWHIIPADRKWVRDAAITEVLASTLEAMKLEYPPLDPAVRNLRIT
jgi:PPK2 family polyphosphate:nucleotide phosphotransferase